MTASEQKPLDPRKSPWKRGDVCSLGFEKHCFVMSYTLEYLEVRWMSDGSIERIPADTVDTVLRVAHGDSLGPDGRRKCYFKGEKWGKYSLALSRSQSAFCGGAQILRKAVWWAR